MAASVTITPSIVAMFGWIIPAPFAMPANVTSTPPSVSRRAARLGWVSVVMIASLARIRLLGVAAQGFRRPFDALRDLAHRHRHADDPGAHHQCGARGQAERLLHEACHLRRVAHPLLAGHRVGIFGIDRHRADALTGWPGGSPRHIKPARHAPNFA